MVKMFQYQKISCGYGRLPDEDNDMEVDYENPLNILSKEKKLESSKKQRAKDAEDDDDCHLGEVNDPQYEIFLKCMKEHEKSFIVEGEQNGLPFRIEYAECIPESRRKLRSSRIQVVGPSNQILGADNQRLPSTPTKPPQRRLRNNSGSVRNKNVQSSTDKNMEMEPDYYTYLSQIIDVVDCPQVTEPSNQILGAEIERSLSTPTWRQFRIKSESVRRNDVKLSTNRNVEKDPDYSTFLSHTIVVDNRHILKYGGYTIVYEEKDGQNNHEEEAFSDGSSSDLKSIDSYTFNKAKNPNFSENNHEQECNKGGNSSDEEILEGTLDKNGVLHYSKINESSTKRVRQEVITILRKPYDQCEYDRLWQKIILRSPEMRHMDLRYGRARSFPTNKEGKSLLDYYPELEAKLSQVPNDKLRRLNLLRGFFFWLKMPGPLCPWEDAECLAITPESR